MRNFADMAAIIGWICAIFLMCDINFLDHRITVLEKAIDGAVAAKMQEGCNNE